MYQAIEKNNRLLPFGLPCQKTKGIGYADDTTICIKDDNGFLEIFKILSMFESASNSKINIGKTRIYGFGNWEWRSQWPIKGIKTEFEHFNTLGIIFSTDYDKALKAQWEKIYVNIQKSLKAMTGRYLNIYQKAVIVNAMIASKLWYTSHVYPLPDMWAGLINTEIRTYIWDKPNKNPIRLDVICKSRDRGGIGLLDIKIKAKSIFANTTLKMFSNSDSQSLIKYYVGKELSEILGIRHGQVNRIRVQAPKYYKYALDIIKKFTSHKDFPKLNSKLIYMLKPDVISNIEGKNPGYDWGNIWKCVACKFMNVNDRPIVYKYVHEVIPTNKKLFQIRARDNPNCDHCNIEDSKIHRFYECPLMQECLNWIRRLILYLCGMNTNQESLYGFMTFDVPKVNIKVKNTIIIIMSSYVSCAWYNRDRLDIILHILRAKIINDQKIRMKILGNKAHKLFTENYCKYNIEFIKRL